MTAYIDTEDAPPELLKLQGIFGPTDLVPLLTDLLPSVIVNSIVIGFCDPGKRASGLFQNDGHIFPLLHDRTSRLFTPYCNRIRDTDKGAALCAACDQRGVKLLVGDSLTEDDRSLITPLQTNQDADVCAYRCHAGNLELIAPIRLYLHDDVNRESIVIASIWAGQFRGNGQFDETTMLKELSLCIGVPFDELNDLFLDRPTVKIEKAAAALHETAMELSKTVTDLYRTRQRRLGSQVVNDFATGLVASVSRSLAHANSVELLKDAMKRGLSAFVKSYSLRSSVIYRLREDYNGKRLIAEVFASPVLFHSQPVSIPYRDTTFSADATPTQLPEPLVVTPESDRLLHKLIRSTKRDTTPEPAAYMYFSPGDGYSYIWLAVEFHDKRWQIRADSLQPEFSEVFHRVASLISEHIKSIAAVKQREEILQELRITTRRLKERETQAQSLIVNMAHLVSRPLLQLKLAINAILARPNDELAKNHLNTTLFELRRASSNFKAFAKLTVGEADEAVKCKINAYDAMKHARDMLMPLSRLKRRAINVTILDRFVESASVESSRDGIQDVLENMLHNAIKYSDGGQSVECELDCEDGYVVVRIVNYGCGIADEEAEKVFELEYRSQMAKSTAVEGTGLGLWIVKQYVDAVGGSVALAECDYVRTLSEDYGPGRRQFKVVFELRLPKKVG